MTETEIQKQIIDYCTLKGALVFRMNSGSRNYNNKQAPKGTPDLFVVRKPIAIWIEVKCPGKDPTEVQKEMHEKLRARGQRVIVARSVEDVIKEIG